MPRSLCDMPSKLYFYDPIFCYYRRLPQIKNLEKKSETSSFVRCCQSVYLENPSRSSLEKYLGKKEKIREILSRLFLLFFPCGQDHKLDCGHCGNEKSQTNAGKEKSLLRKEKEFLTQIPWLEFPLPLVKRGFFFLCPYCWDASFPSLRVWESQKEIANRKKGRKYLVRSYSCLLYFFLRLCL